MNYLVLARKWRPKSFGTLVGQEHVVRALSHALATGRLHHAYLFTGTRGVGKTTISRILAKALNCETGVTVEPCGECDACRAIDADRFPDYVEMDAASNRGVEDMATLLDRAVYAPVQGRYKVYMIDEVHMLTGHAFNAMLKTLEEPPEHVKFILATTDPQKIPVTVLSRCLQFNLKQMPSKLVAEYLRQLLEKEGVPFEPEALRHLAKAANGSMRDALSLLDQAIAHGAGKIEETQVVNMLGTVGDDYLYAVLDALMEQNAEAVLAVADAMQERSLSFDAALQALASLLHRVALAQFSPEAIVDPVERQRLAPYVTHFDAEFLQLAYQIMIHGRHDLSLAPDEYTGFSMALLRLYAFRPEQPPALEAGQREALPLSMPDKKPTSATPSASTKSLLFEIKKDKVSEEMLSQKIKAAEEKKQDTIIVTEEISLRESLPSETFASLLSEETHLSSGVMSVKTEPAPERQAAAEDNISLEEKKQAALLALRSGDWMQLLHTLDLNGMTRELAQHCVLRNVGDNTISLCLSAGHRHLLEVLPTVTERLQSRFESVLGQTLKINIEVGELESKTPAQHYEAEQRSLRAVALEALSQDSFVNELKACFGAVLLEDSVVLNR